MTMIFPLTAITCMSPVVQRTRLCCRPRLPSVLDPHMVLPEACECVWLQGRIVRAGQARVVSFEPVGGGHDAPFERGVAFVHDAQMLRHVRPTGDEVVDLVCASARYSRPITRGPWLASRSTWRSVPIRTTGLAISTSLIFRATQYQLDRRPTEVLRVDVLGGSSIASGVGSPARNRANRLDLSSRA